MADVAVKENKGVKQVRASARSLRLSPRKMRLVTNMVKGLPVNDAMTQLAFTNKKGAKYLAKLLQSAVANAENNFSLNADKLFVKTVTCDMGQTMKRYFPRARGSAFIIRRKLSHVNVILEERTGPAVKKSRFASLRRAKKDKPVITKEGSTGTPETTVDPLNKSNNDPHAVTEHKTAHHEQDQATLKEKDGSENQLK